MAISSTAIAHEHRRVPSQAAALRRRHLPQRSRRPGEGREGGTPPGVGSAAGREPTPLF